MNKKFLLLLLGASCLALSSCQKTIFDIVGGLGGIPGESDYVISLPDGNYGQAMNTISMEDYSLNTGIVPTPAEGNVNVLVLPIVIEDYDLSSSAKSKVLADLDLAFNGQAEETGWQSVSSFYEESSYGKLNFRATVAPWYDSGLTVAEIERQNVSSDSAEGVSYLMRSAVEHYRSQSGSSLSEFDSNGDGFLDAVWMVYSAPYDGSGASTVQWAFTFWDYEAATDASYSAPVGYAYSWASYEFLYEGYGRSSVDAHTFVHETGHLLGLNDYYDTSGLTSPTGYVDMMDANIIDHCAYTKFSLGWISPYVVTGEGSITIGNLAETGDAVLIPTKAGYRGSSFGEYLLLELYAPVGLNRQDAVSPYPGNGIQGFSRPGIRVYHVDARLQRLVEINGEYYLYDYVNEIPPEGCYMGASNTISSQADASEAFRQISLIAPSRVGVSFETENICASKAGGLGGTVIDGVSDCLFMAGEGMNYADAAIKKQFPSGRQGKQLLSNDEKGFAYSFEVASIASDGSEATINFTRA